MGVGIFVLGKWRWVFFGGGLEKREEKHDVINSKQ